MRLYGLIGYPVTHSFSRNYFLHKFSDENITGADYRLFPVKDAGEVRRVLSENPDLAGFNVTIPHKISILPYLDRLSSEAAAIGAVNCVKIERSNNAVSLCGYNTDASAFAESLAPLLAGTRPGALVLGTGGASSAVCYALGLLGIPFTRVSRNAGTAAITYASLNREIIETNLLIINTTPLGMFPGTDTFPEIPYQFVGSGHLLYDLVYNPEETLFLKKGRQAGARVKNGREMLELQAQKSWEIWNG